MRLRRSWAEWKWLLVAVPTSAATWGALHAMPFRRLVRWTDVPRRGARSDRSGGADPPDAATIRRMAWAVHAVCRRFFPDRPCLTQALALRFLLARRGMASDLRIGVARSGDAVAAHAWLERDGHVLIGGADAPQRYQALTGRADLSSLLNAHPPSDAF